jgi:hypothetical protein
MSSQRGKHPSVREAEGWWRRRRGREYYYSEGEPCLTALSSSYLSAFPSARTRMSLFFLMTRRRLGEILGRFRFKLISNSIWHVDRQRFWTEASG